MAFETGGGAANAYVRIILDGKRLSWGTNIIHWRLNSAGSDDIADDSELPAIRHAFQAWRDVTGSRTSFYFEGKTPSSTVGNADHLVLFDENNQTGYFPPGSGTVAITPIAYDTGSGRIVDADILFNGKDWAWSTDGSPGTFDVEDVVTHEIGHFIGLDHTPVLGGTMWPYVSHGQWLHRSLSADDASGAVAVNPYGSDGRLTGTVYKQGGSLLQGAMVTVVDSADGRSMASNVSGSDGRWTVRGLPAGDYLVYVAPIEGAISAAQFAGNGTVQTAFGANFYGGHEAPLQFHVSSGATVDCGILTLPADTPLKDSTSSVLILRPGESRSFNISGSSFLPGQMQVWEESPYLSLSNVSSGSSWIQGVVTAAANCPYGLYDLYLKTPAGAMEAVTGVIDVVAPAPQLLAVDRSSASIQGGETIRLTGTGFQDGAFVLFNGVEAASVTFVDANTLDVVTPAAPAGVVTLSLNNPDGQQSRLSGAFAFAALPVLNSVFPSAGQAAGGTSLILDGQDFAPEIQVQIGDQTATVEWISSSVLKVSAPPHAVGAVDIRLQNPMTDPVIVSGMYSYVETADPVIHDFTPTRGGDGGGVKVRFLGNHLDQVSIVRFGVDPVSGQGGKDASSVQVLGSDSVEARAPAYKPGSYGVKLALPNGQGVVAPASFLYTPEGGSGGGGGCGGVAGRPGARGGPGDLPAFLLLFLGFWIFKKNHRPESGLAEWRTSEGS